MVICAASQRCVGCWNSAGDSEASDQVWDSQPIGGESHVIRELGIRLSDDGRLDRTEVWLRRAADLGDSDAQSLLAQLLIEQGDTAEAEYRLRQALRGWGSDVSGCALGRLLWKLGKTDEAAEWFAGAADGDNELAMMQMGTMLFEIGRTSESIEWFTSCSEREPELEVFLGKALEKTGDIHSAEARYRSSIASGTDLASYSLAEMLLRRDEADAARPLLETASNAGEVQAMVALAALLAASGDRAESERWGKEATRRRQGPMAWLVYDRESKVQCLSELSELPDRPQ